MKEFAKDNFVAFVACIMVLGFVLGIKCGEKRTMERLKVTSIDSIGCEIEYDGEIYRYNV